MYQQAASYHPTIIMSGSASSNNSLVNLNPNSPPPPSTLPFPQLDPPLFSPFSLSNHEALIQNTHPGFQETGRNFSIFRASSSPPPPMASKAAAAAAKKDRHSKICTAQGVRDRRVRLSIGIAREFFDLQDMLGYDKASKTLEWLLTKSKRAIREISRAKKQRLTREAAPEAADDSKGSSSSSDQTNFGKHMKEMPQEVRAASPSGVHHHQSVRAHSCSSSSRLVEPSQHQYSAMSAPPVLDLARLNTEDKSIDFPLWPQNWDISYNSMILQPSSFSLQDSEPYI